MPRLVLMCQHSENCSTHGFKLHSTYRMITVLNITKMRSLNHVNWNYLLSHVLASETVRWSWLTSELKLFPCGQVVNHKDCISHSLQMRKGEKYLCKYTMTWISNCWTYLQMNKKTPEWCVNIFLYRVYDTSIFMYKNSRLNCVKIKCYTHVIQ